MRKVSQLAVFAVLLAGLYCPAWSPAQTDSNNSEKRFHAMLEKEISQMKRYSTVKGMVESVNNESGQITVALKPGSKIDTMIIRNGTCQ